MVKAGYVIDRTTGRDLIEYRITRRGGDALAEHA
jgi:DNA-binding PadR family transcriptional regulator